MRPAAPFLALPATTVIADDGGITTVISPEFVLSFEFSSRFPVISSGTMSPEPLIARTAPARSSAGSRPRLPGTARRSIR
jgi:hypothetical protein